MIIVSDTTPINYLVLIYRDGAGRGITCHIPVKPGAEAITLATAPLSVGAAYGVIDALPKTKVIG